jgi:hypothetical protein
LSLQMRNPVFYFWDSWGQKLTGRRGGREKRLPFYLSEYVWQFSHRQLNPEQQMDKLLKLLFDLQNQEPNLF